MYIDQKIFKTQSINVKGNLFHFDEPKIMGIINLSEDSFYENDAETPTKEIINKIESFIKNGASIIDLGGASTRPNAKLPSVKIELSRVIPVLKLVREKFPETLISIDTVRSKVAEEALINGADLINDVSGGYSDKKIISVIQKYKCPYILTHNLEHSVNSQKLESQNTIKEVIRFFSKRIQELQTHGINDIIIDPGFGFSKNTQQDYELIKNFEMLHLLHAPILVGVSRKSLIYKILDRKPETSLNGTTAIHSFLISRNASLFRVHDIKEMQEVKMLWKATF
jgi:dihydropteroate synthase